jgi:hypothetical protein
VELAIREARRWLFLRKRAQEGRLGAGHSDWEVERMLGLPKTGEASFAGGGGPGPSTLRSRNGPDINQEEISSVFNPVSNSTRGNKADRQDALALSAPAASMALPIVNIPQSSKRRLSMRSISSGGFGEDRTIIKVSETERHIASQKRQRVSESTSRADEVRRETAVGWEWNEEESGYWIVEPIEAELKVFD